MSGRLVREIRQGKPFASLEEEAALNLWRTSAAVEQAWAEALKPHGLSVTQYNALRILRGAGAAGIACQEIAVRMIRRDPDITRLLGRLEARGFILRQRSPEDRRVILTRIRPAGIRLLASLDAVVRRVPKRVLGHLGAKRVRLLTRLLEDARSRN